MIAWATIYVKAQCWQKSWALTSEWLNQLIPYSTPRRMLIRGLMPCPTSTRLLGCLRPYLTCQGTTTCRDNTNMWQTITRAGCRHLLLLPHLKLPSISCILFAACMICDQLGSKVGNACGNVQ